MQFTYETHMINDRLMPFVYHVDRVNKMTALLPNYHTNIELLFCIEGCGNVICDSHRYDFAPGDIVVINSNILHKVESQDSVRYYCLIVDEEFCSSNGIDVSKVFFDTRIIDPEVRQAYESVCRAFASREETKAVAVRYCILGLLLVLLRKYSSPVNETVQKNALATGKRIKKVVEYIQGNLSSGITLDDISSHIGISKFHLSRDFKKFTGNTIFEYINMSRCKTAAVLIASGMSVSAAAVECGFENMSYFSRTYKKYMGKLPSADM